MAIVLGWMLGLALVVVTPIIASKKGRSPVLWFILALIPVVGFVSFCVLLVLPHSEDELMECPHCAEQIRIAANVCKHCGRDTFVAVASPSRRQTEAVTKTARLRKAS